jgi:hypothetical protein
MPPLLLLESPINTLLRVRQQWQFRSWIFGSELLFNNSCPSGFKDRDNGFELYKSRMPCAISVFSRRQTYRPQAALLFLHARARGFFRLCSACLGNVSLESILMEGASLKRLALLVINDDFCSRQFGIRRG